MAGFPIGLDFAAILPFAAAQDVDLELLTDVLPEFEAIVIASLSPDGPDPSDSEED